jgi:hypothetical protein
MNELSWNFFGGVEKHDKTSVRAARVSVEIRPRPRQDRGVTSVSTSQPFKNFWPPRFYFNSGKG